MPGNLVLINTSIWIFALWKNTIPEIKDRVDADAMLLHADRHFDKMAAKTSLQVESHVS